MKAEWVRLSLADLRMLQFGRLFLYASGDEDAAEQAEQFEANYLACGNPHPEARAQLALRDLYSERGWMGEFAEGAKLLLDFVGYCEKWWGSEENQKALSFVLGVESRVRGDVKPLTAYQFCVMKFCPDLYMGEECHVGVVMLTEVGDCWLLWDENGTRIRNVYGDLDYWAPFAKETSHHMQEVRSAVRLESSTLDDVIRYLSCDGRNVHLSFGQIGSGVSRDPKERLKELAEHCCPRPPELPSDLYNFKLVTALSLEDLEKEERD